jgi:DNA-binding MarR family transcriptional regulator
MIVAKLNRLLQLVEHRHAEALKELNLTSRQVLVMRSIAEHGDRPSQTEIVTGTGMDRSTLSDVMRRLSKRNLVKRERSRTDSRAWKLALTSEGRQTVERAARAMARAEKAAQKEIAGLAAAEAAVDRCLAALTPALAAAE